LELTVDVPALPVAALTTSESGESSVAVRARVVAARTRQCERYAADGIRTNAELTPSLMARHCALDYRASTLLEASATRTALSARGYDRVRKVARTVADLASADAISSDHVAEALQFRML
jgi:magnesium chelatase family protein